MTYSGHGGQVPDVNGDEDEAQDETWCLFDRMVIDDELYQMWSQFEAGVRIFVLSDSCHSRTVLKQTIYSQISSLPPLIKQYERGKTRGMKSKVSKYRNLPREVEEQTYQAHAAMYDTLQWLAGRGKRATIGGSVLLISGCMDNQLSADGDGNGLFTATLLEVWNNGGFNGGYETFWREIQEKMPPTQTPNYYKVGVEDTDFEAQKPFTIGESVGSGGTEPSPTSSRPSITAEADTMTRDDGSPRFQVSPGANRYYIFEIATDVGLFVNRPDGNTSEFFATYFDSESPARLTGSSYRLPDYAWEAIKGADRLYYRIGTTSSESGWDDYTLSSDDGASDTPSIEITAGEGRIPPKRKAPTTSGARRAATTPPPSAGAEGSPWTAGSRSIEEALRASGMPASDREAAEAI